MCGIAGFSLIEGTPNTRERSIRGLLAIEHRGTDATGVATFVNGEPWYCKAAVPASQFDTNILGERSMIMHTRYATTGSPTNNDNNHPIITEGVMGVHNGMLWNHRGSASEAGVSLEYEVDSELLFRIISKHGLESPDALSEVEGDATIAWLDVNEPNKTFVAALGGRPLVVGSNRWGVYFASTQDAVNAMAMGGTKSIHVPDGSLMVLEDGEVKSIEPWARLNEGAWIRRSVNRSLADGGVGYSPSTSVAGSGGTSVVSSPMHMQVRFNSTVEQSYELLDMACNRMQSEYCADMTSMTLDSIRVVALDLHDLHDCMSAENGDIVWSKWDGFYVVKGGQAYSIPKATLSQWQALRFDELELEEEDYWEDYDRNVIDDFLSTEDTF